MQKTSANSSLRQPIIHEQQGTNGVVSFKKTSPGVGVEPLTEQELHALTSYLQQLETTGKPVSLQERPNFKEYEEVVRHIEDVARKSKSNTGAIERTIKAFKLPEKIHQRLDVRTMRECHLSSALPSLEVLRTEPLVPPLPAGVLFPPEISRDGCPWLDEYEQFSRIWSPRGYQHFHTACGLWLLSTIAARRVWCPFGPGGEYTPLYIALVAQTTQHRKSTTAGIAKDILREIGLSWLLCPDTITPQKLLSNMAGRLPRNYIEMSEEEQNTARLRYGMSGQLGWFYDEFGQHLDAMTAKNGIMSDFKGMLRRFDDCEEAITNDTLSRDVEQITLPYLALLASMTPADIKPYAGKDAKFWRDGFFARFAFITPPLDDRNRARFPDGMMEIPPSLTTPLIGWHKRLGVPEVKVILKENAKGDIIGYEIARDQLPRHTYPLGPGVVEAFYRYNDALDDLVLAHRLEQLAGNYGRMAKKALRIALLFASLENSKDITIQHWAKAQEMVETWRVSLHELYAQVNLHELADACADEDDILRLVEKLSAQGKPPTARELARYTRKYDTPTIRSKLSALALAGEVEELREGKAPRYKRLAEQAERWSEVQSCADMR